MLTSDLGGGTFDVSTMSIGDEQFDVKAVGGDTHMGSSDFDSRLVDHCAEKSKPGHAEIDVITNAKATSRLRKACENAKGVLCLLERTCIHFESLLEDINFSEPISR